MATPISCYRPTSIRASTAPGIPKPDQNRLKLAPSKWWTPLFGWPSDHDYIDNPNNVSELSDTDFEMARSRSRFSLGCFTEDKAKQLRKKTTESVTFHDIMYHSPIASRLASDVYDD